MSLFRAAVVVVIAAFFVRFGAVGNPAKANLLSKGGAKNQNSSSQTLTDDISGSWSGNIKYGINQSIDLAFKIWKTELNIFTGTVNIPSQSIFDLQINITIEDSNVLIEASAHTEIFRGKLRSDGMTIDGTWIIDDLTKFPLSLVRTASTTN